MKPVRDDPGLRVLPCYVADIAEHQQVEGQKEFPSTTLVLFGLSLENVSADPVSPLGGGMRESSGDAAHASGRMFQEQVPRHAIPPSEVNDRIPLSGG